MAASQPASLSCCSWVSDSKASCSSLQPHGNLGVHVQTLKFCWPLLQAAGSSLSPQQHGWSSACSRSLLVSSAPATSPQVSLQPVAATSCCSTSREGMLHTFAPTTTTTTCSVPCNTMGKPGSHPQVRSGACNAQTASTSSHMAMCLPTCLTCSPPAAAAVVRGGSQRATAAVGTAGGHITAAPKCTILRPQSSLPVSGSSTGAGAPAAAAATVTGLA